MTMTDQIPGDASTGVGTHSDPIRTKIAVEFDLMELRTNIARAEKPSDNSNTTAIRARVLARLYRREAELAAELKTAPAGDTLRPYRGSASSYIAFRKIEWLPEGSVNILNDADLNIPAFLQRKGGQR